MGERVLFACLERCTLPLRKASVVLEKGWGPRALLQLPVETLVQSLPHPGCSSGRDGG